MKKYKDACDECGKFDFCRGVEGRVLCPACEEKLKQEKEKEDGQQNQDSSTKGATKTAG